MTTTTSSMFGVAVHAWILEGWAKDALLPKHPTEKRPGRWLAGNGGRWVGLQGRILKEGLAGAVQPTSWPDVEAWPWEGLCVRGTYYPALDIDCEHQVAVHGALKAAEAFAGQQLAWRGRESSQRLLAPFEAATPGTIAAWRPVRFKMPNGMVGMVELKAHGTQWVAAGRHPDGMDYRWLPDEIPDAVCGLPTLRDQAHADALRDAIVDALERAGAELLPTGPAGPSGGQPGAYRDPDDHDALVPLEALQGALAATPCDAEIMPNHDEAVRVMAGLRWILGRAGQSIPDFVMEWLLTYPGAGDEWIQARWDSFYSIAPSGAAFLDALARHCADRGWYRQVQAAIDGHKARDIFDDGDVDEDDLESAQRVAPGGQGEAPARPRPPAANVVRYGSPEEALQVLTRRVIHTEVKTGWIDRSRVGTEVRIMDTQSFNDSEIGCQIAAFDWDNRQRQGPKRKAAEVMIERPDLTRVEAITYDPLKPSPYFEENGVRHLNTYVPFRVKRVAVSDEEVRTFLWFVALVIPDERDRRIVLDWMSWIAQHPGLKIFWAPVFFSEAQGSGKDSLLRVVNYLVGPHNFKEIDGRTTEQVFNAEWVTSVVTYLNELESAHRRNVYDGLKRWVAGTGTDTIQVHQKFMPSYRVPNRHCWVITTNKPDALALEAGDRRFAVIQFREQKLAAGDAAAFHTFLDEDGGKVAAWLAGRQVSAEFSRFECPAPSDAKVSMTHRAAAREVEDFVELLTEGAWAERQIVSWPEAKAMANARPGLVRQGLALAGFKVPGNSDVKGRIHVPGGKVKVYVRTGSECDRGTPHARLLRVLADEQRSIGSRDADETEAALEPRGVEKGSKVTNRDTSEGTEM